MAISSVLQGEFLGELLKFSPDGFPHRFDQFRIVRNRRDNGCQNGALALQMPESSDDIRLYFSISFSGQRFREFHVLAFQQFHGTADHRFEQGFFGSEMIKEAPLLTLASLAAVSSVRCAGPRLATISSAAWRISSRESLLRLRGMDVELGAWLMTACYEKPVG